jgi:hypothetical protein
MNATSILSDQPSRAQPLGFFSGRLIPAIQNQEGGRHLEGHYRDFRLIARDAFWVAVIP